MQWADVTRPPKDRVLRQFAGLCLVFFGGAAAWRAWHTGPDVRAAVFVVLGFAIGGLGLWRPRMVRYVFTGWMIAAFPIGWTVSKVMLGVVFFLVFTPIALVFRLMGRDNLLLHRARRESYWTTRGAASSADQYLRQF